MSVSSVGAASQAIAMQANKPGPAVDAPHDGDSDDHAAPVQASVPDGVGKAVDKSA